MSELRNIVVEFISLVKKGANLRTVIYKSADESPMAWQVPIAKYDEEKGVVYGIVYAPDDTDSQGDHATAGEIEKASFAFMKSTNARQIDKNHSSNPEQAFVAESWIVKDHDSLFPDENIGAWAVGIKLESDELKKQVKDGDIEGLSMAGTADKYVKKSNISEEEEGLFSKFMKWLPTPQKTKEVISDMDKTEVQEIVNAAIEKMDKPLGEDQLGKIIMKAMEGTIKPIAERLEKMEKKSPGTSQDDDEIKKAGDLTDAECEEKGAALAKTFNEQNTVHAGGTLAGGA